MILAAPMLKRASLLFQLAGQIARAATVFCIDEVVVFDSTPALENGGTGDGEESGARFLVRILEYLETPQYLRRRLFPMHKNLKFVVRCQTMLFYWHLMNDDFCWC